MHLDDIPINFQSDITNYVTKLVNTIQVKNDHIEINGTKCPTNIKTQHQKYVLGSKEHINISIELFFLLKIFHEYCESNNILYSISYGNLLGLERENDMLLFDDDIDLFVAKKDARFLQKLWFEHGRAKIIFDNRWVYKNIKLGSYDIILIKHRRSLNFFKIKLNDSFHAGQKDIGGVDITYLLGNNDCFGTNLHFLRNCENDIRTYRIVDYGPVKTMCFIPSLCMKVLNTSYGDKWNERIHPNLKTKNIV
jgi:hypothetical protein